MQYILPLGERTAPDHFELEEPSPEIVVVSNALIVGSIINTESCESGQQYIFPLGASTPPIHFEVFELIVLVT